MKLATWKRLAGRLLGYKLEQLLRVGTRLAGC